MLNFTHDRPADLHALRAHLYDVFGWTYHGKSVPPAGLHMLSAARMIHSPSGAFRCNGHIRGTGYRDIVFDIHEVAARLEGVKLVVNQKGETVETGFNGIIISIAHHVSFLSRTVIKRDHGLLNRKTVEGMQRVGLVDSAFERAFEVYADDQVEGRALLSPDFMERLLAFDAHPKFQGLQIGFIGNRMYAVLPNMLGESFGHDMPYYTPKSAADAVKAEMQGVFSLLADMDGLHASARAQTDAEIQAERRAYYDGKSALIDAAVQTAMADGALTGSTRPSYLTDDAHTAVSPMFHGMLRPRF